MTTKRESDESIAFLRETLSPGDVVYTILRSVSRSGMQRIIDVVVMENGTPRSVGWHVARALDWRFDMDRYGIKVGGTGMDMGFHVVYTLSHVLFRDGFDCIGEACPSNDHTNAWNAYANGRCFICGANLPDFERGADGLYVAHKEPKTSSPFMRDRKAVWPAECVTAKQHHTSGGYALSHKWL